MKGNKNYLGNRYDPIAGDESLVPRRVLILSDLVLGGLILYLLVGHLLTFVGNWSLYVAGWYGWPLFFVGPLAVWLLIKTGDMHRWNSVSKIWVGVVVWPLIAYVWVIFSHGYGVEPNPAQVFEEAGKYFERIPLGVRVPITPSQYSHAKIVELREWTAMLLFGSVIFSYPSWAGTRGRVAARGQAGAADD